MFNTLLRIILDNYHSFCSEANSCLLNNQVLDEKKFTLNHKLPKISILKNSNPLYKLVDSLAICAEYSNLVRGIEMFYRGHSKLPHFKSRNDKNSYTTSQVNNNIRIENNKIRIPKVGFIKVRGMRYIPDKFKIKRANIFEDKTGKFFISLIFEFNNNEKNLPNNNIVGLDFKIGDIFVSNDDFTPKYHDKYFKLLNKIPSYQKNVNRKNKFSKNYWKSVIKLRKFHRSIVNIRVDMKNKISTLLTNFYDFIIIENLSIKEIVYKLGKGKNAYNTSFCNFVKKLIYKVNGAVIKIDKWFPSSKLCSNCGKKKKHLKLSQRIYNCNFCGFSINRDLNAAINIRNEGIRILKSHL